MLSVKTVPVRKATRAAVTIMLSLLFSVPVFSQLPAIDENSAEIQVKYLDGDNEAMLFNLKYDNDSGNDFKLMVLNETGEVLFQNSYSGKKFRKRIRLTRLTDSDGVTFLIRSPKENVQLSRRVKITSKVADPLPVAQN